MRATMRTGSNNQAMTLVEQTYISVCYQKKKKRTQRLFTFLCAMYLLDLDAMPIQMMSNKHVQYKKNDTPHVFTPKFIRKIAGTRKLPRSYHQGIDCMRVGIS